MPPNSVVMADVPRDPSHYYPRDHALDMAHKRDIETELLGEIIQDGVTQKAKGAPSEWRFIKEFSNYADPIYLVADVDSGAVVTVAYYTQHQHPEIDA